MILTLAGQSQRLSHMRTWIMEGVCKGIRTHDLCDAGAHETIGEIFQQVWRSCYKNKNDISTATRPLSNCRSVIGNHVREQHGNEPCEIAKNFRVLRKCSNKFDCLIFEKLIVGTLSQNQTNRTIPSAQSFLLNTSYSFHSFHFLFILHFRIPLFLLFVCKYFAFYFHSIVFINCYICGIFYPWTWTLKWPRSGRNVVLISYRAFLRESVNLSLNHTA